MFFRSYNAQKIGYPFLLYLKIKREHRDKNETEYASENNTYCLKKTSGRVRERIAYTVQNISQSKSRVLYLFRDAAVQQARHRLGRGLLYIHIFRNTPDKIGKFSYKLREKEVNNTHENQRQ